MDSLGYRHDYEKGEAIAGHKYVSVYTLTNNPFDIEDVLPHDIDFNEVTDNSGALASRKHTYKMRREKCSKCLFRYERANYKGKTKAYCQYQSDWGKEQNCKCWWGTNEPHSFLNKEEAIADFNQEPLIPMEVVSKYFNEFTELRTFKNGNTREKSIGLIPYIWNGKWSGDIAKIRWSDRDEKDSLNVITEAEANKIIAASTHQPRDCTPTQVKAVNWLLRDFLDHDSIENGITSSGGVGMNCKRRSQYYSSSRSYRLCNIYLGRDKVCLDFATQSMLCGTVEVDCSSDEEAVTFLYDWFRYNNHRR